MAQDRPPPRPAPRPPPRPAPRPAPRPGARLGLHPQLARVSGVDPPPGMSWQIGHYVFIPCNDQIHGDGQPDLESVALLPAETTVQGPGAPGGINVGATRDGGREMWTGSAWVPNPSGKASAGVPGAGPLIAWQSTRGGGAEIWNGSAWVPNTGRQGGGPGGTPTYGTRRNGGREVWNGSGWVAFRRGWDQGPGTGALIPWQSTRGGGAEIWTGTSWIPNPQAADMSATDALSLAGMLGGQQSPGGYTLSPSDLVALGAQAGQGGQAPLDTDGGGQDLLSLLAAGSDGGGGGGDDGGADAIDLDPMD